MAYKKSKLLMLLTSATILAACSDNGGAPAAAADMVAEQGNVVQLKVFDKSINAAEHQTTYTIDYGDGTEVVTKDKPGIVEHEFQHMLGAHDDNTYDVVITAKNKFGVDKVTKQIVVQENKIINPVAIGVSIDKDCSDRACTFTVNTDGISMSKYSWTLGDGSSKQTLKNTLKYDYSADGAYTVKVTAIDTNGSEHESFLDIVIGADAPATASFTTKCTDLICTLNGSASQASKNGKKIKSYSWDFGNGKILDNQTLPTTIVSYKEAGNYVVKLTVTDNLGKTNTQEQTLTVHDNKPTPSFEFSCDGNVCTFKSTSIAADDTDINYKKSSWKFGDESLLPARGETAIHTFRKASGTSKVTLSIVDNKGRKAEISHDVTYQANDPEAYFIGICNEGTCKFDAGKSTAGDGHITKYSWNFGDGSKVISSVVPTTAHVYKEGQYTVELTVENSLGKKAKYEFDINATAQANPTVEIKPLGCEGLKCTLQAEASSNVSGARIKSLTWFFGDGSPVPYVQTRDFDKPVFHTYSKTGTSTVELVALDTAGRVSKTSTSISYEAREPEAAFTVDCNNGLKCTFDASSSKAFDGSIRKYDWTFGDGQVAKDRIVPTVAHKYSKEGSFKAELLVITSTGENGYTSNTVNPEVNEPVVSFTSLCTGQTCSFDASATKAVSGSIKSYNWNFGDGSVANGRIVPTVAHKFDAEGKQHITLLVENTDGGKADKQEYVQAVNIKPTVSFNEKSCDGLKCTFSANAASGVSGGQIKSLIWKFGDDSALPFVQTRDFDKSVFHTYRESGTSLVSVQAVDSLGKTSEPVTVMITHNAKAPKADFIYECTPMKVAGEAHFLCNLESSSIASESAIVNYTWTANGAVGEATHTSKTPYTAYEYASAGKYNVTLNIIDKNGMTAEYSEQLSVGLKQI